MLIIRTWADAVNIFYGRNFYSCKKVSWHEIIGRGSQHNNTQHNDTQHKGLICGTQHKRHSTIMLSVVILCAFY